jgi:VWFA-related protein
MRLFGRITGGIFPILLVVLAGTAQSFGQSKPGEGAPQVPTIKVHTKLVLIPAVVADAKGNRVTDLKKEEFVVLEDGKRQEIELFDHVTTKAEVMKPAEVPAGGVHECLKTRSESRTIFVLDLLNSKMEEQKEAQGVV